MMYLLLWIVTWVWADTPLNQVWTDEQVQQEILPNLNGELTSLQSKVAQNAYLSNTGTFTEAFGNGQYLIYGRCLLSIPLKL